MAEQMQTEDLTDKFEELTQLHDRLDVRRLWDAATERERRALLDELLGAITVHPDRLVVQVHGAPALNVAFSEAGLKNSDLSGVEGGRLVQGFEFGLDPERRRDGRQPLPSPVHLGVEDGLGHCRSDGGRGHLADHAEHGQGIDLAVIQTGLDLRRSLAPDAPAVSTCSVAGVTRYTFNVAWEAGT